MSRASNLVLNKRKQLGISQGKLCRALGYTTPQYLSNFERDKCYFPAPKLKKLCQILGIPRSQMREEVLRDLMGEFLKEWGK